jgi:hypothetical protein
MDEPQDEQQQNGADRGVDDRRDHPASEMDTELRQQPAPDEGADDPNDHIADESKAGPSYDLAGQPSGNETDQQDDEKAFARHVHVCPYGICSSNVFEDRALGLFEPDGC